MPAKIFPEKRVWIFDLDGTLVDTMTTMQTQAGRVMAEWYGISREDAEEMYRQTSGKPFMEQIAALFPQHQANPQAIAAFEAYKDRYLEWATPFPEVQATLAQLQQAGHFLAVSSNNFQAKVEAAVAAFALPIDLACGWKDGEGKGAAHFTRVREASGQPMDTMVFVGDSLHDAAMACTHGLGFVARAGTFTRAEFTTRFPGVRVVSTLGELV